MSTSSRTSFCRICYSFSSLDLIPMPCKCKSTIGHVHRKCLGEWIVFVGKDACEICHSRYDENVVVIQKRSLKTLLCTFISGPLPVMLNFLVSFSCLAGIGIFMSRKLSIIYEPFERVMVDAGDIANIRTIRSYLNAAIVIPSIMSYIHLAKLSFLSFRELLSTLHNWWNHDDGNSGRRLTFQISNAYQDDNEQQLSGGTSSSSSSSSELMVASLNVF